MQAAAALHHTLNDRQRETLRLVADGKTNPEIAELLGMTLDGAKWNVSELLTKLGFRSREELAEYYRWHNQPARRIGRWARGFASLPVAKWVAGGASSLVVAGALVIGISMASGEPGTAGASPPFVLEAVITVNSVAESAGTQPSSTNAGNAPVPAITVSTMRWMYEDNDEYRYRITNAEYDFEVVAKDGETWAYDAQQNTYQLGTSVPDYPDDLVIYPALSFMLGPVPRGSVAQLLEIRGGGELEFRYERTGSETMLGREVTVYEWGPTGISTSSDGVETSSGTGWLWIDEEAMVILRSDWESEGTSVSAVVTAFDDHPKFDGSTFNFVPPAGAVESEGEGMDPIESGSSSSIGFGADAGDGRLGYTTPSGFLQVTFLPEGFRSAEVEEEQSGGVIVSHRVVFESDESPPRSIVLAEKVRQTGLTDAEREGMLIALRGGEAFVVAEGDLVRLTWAENGHVIVLEATGVPQAELVAIAGGMTVMP